MDKGLAIRLAKEIGPYRALLEPFSADRMTADAFVGPFTKQYLGDSSMPEDDVFDIIDRFFSDVDSYCGDPRLQDADTIDEAELRASARRLLELAGIHVAAPR